MTPLNVSVTPEEQEFILIDLTIGELYKLNCPAASTTFTFGLYEVVQDSRMSVTGTVTININDGTVTFTNTNTEEKWILDSNIGGYESDSVTFTFV